MENINYGGQEIPYFRVSSQAFYNEGHCWELQLYCSHNQTSSGLELATIMYEIMRMYVRWMLYACIPTKTQSLSAPQDMGSPAKRLQNITYIYGKYVKVGSVETSFIVANYGPFTYSTKDS